MSKYVSATNLDISINKNKHNVNICKGYKFKNLFCKKILITEKLYNLL